MAWLEVIRNALNPWIFNSSLTVVLAGLTIGLAWGMRPGARYLLDRLVPAWSALGATVLQGFTVVGGLVLIVQVVGMGAASALIVVAAAFLAGALSNRPNWISDHLATLRIRHRGYYAVGDMVTLGTGCQGRVTAIDGGCTHLLAPNQEVVILANTLVVRHPIITALAQHELPSDLQLTSVDQADADLPSSPPFILSTRSSPADAMGLLLSSPPTDALAPVDALVTPATIDTPAEAQIVPVGEVQRTVVALPVAEAHAPLDRAQPATGRHRPALLPQWQISLLNKRPICGKQRIQILRGAKQW